METSTTNLAENEVQKNWHELTGDEITYCIVSHCAALKLSPKNVHHLRSVSRIFNLGSPKIIFGYKDGKPNYCRIAAESADVMKLLIRQYL